MTNPVIRTVQGKRVIRRPWTGNTGSNVFDRAVAVVSTREDL